MPGIGHQLMPVQPRGEQALAEGDAGRRVGRRQTGCAPAFLARLDDEGREPGREAVGVRLEPAPFSLDEIEGEGVEAPRRAEPDELVPPELDIRLEMLGEAVADPAVDAVGGDHQIGRAERRRILDGMLVVQFDAEFRGAFLQDAEQGPPRDAAETVAAGRDHPTAEMDVDIVPMFEALDDPALRHRVAAAEGRQRLVREHDAPAERVVRPVALMDLDPMRRVGQLHQNGEIEPRRPAADADDAQASLAAAWKCFGRNILYLN